MRDRTADWRLSGAVLFLPSTPSPGAQPALKERRSVSGSRIPAVAVRAIARSSWVVFSRLTPLVVSRPLPER
jgi:hypothetical protein